MSGPRAQPGWGGEAWIRSLLERHEGPLLAYSMRLCRGDLERARDVVQDVFLQLLRADPAEIGEHVAAWLFSVTRNRALDLARQARQQPPLVALDTAGTPSDRSSSSPLEHLAARDDAARALEAVARLPEREQELVRLKFEHGLSYRDMAQVTGLSATNVGFLLHKALRSLRARLPAETDTVRRECAT